MNSYANLDTVLNKSAIIELEDFIFEKYIFDWQNRVSSQNIGKKLRTYKLFKRDYKTELYLKKNIHYRYRCAYETFRCGVTPLKLKRKGMKIKILMNECVLYVMMLKMKNM